MVHEYIIKISDEIMEEEIADRPQELVRCKDCKWWKRRECGTYGTCENMNMEGFFDSDWFCADGERRSE